MAKLTVKICSGTICFIMSGNHLNALVEIIKANYGDEVEVIGSNCLGQCSNSYSKAPFVKINDEIISEVTTEKLIAEIDKRIK